MPFFQQGKSRCQHVALEKSIVSLSIITSSVRDSSAETLWDVTESKLYWSVCQVFTAEVTNDCIMMMMFYFSASHMNASGQPRGGRRHVHEV